MDLFTPPFLSSSNSVFGNHRYGPIHHPSIPHCLPVPIFRAYLSRPIQDHSDQQRTSGSTQDSLSFVRVDLFRPPGLAERIRRPLYRFGQDEFRRLSKGAFFHHRFGFENSHLRSDAPSPCDCGLKFPTRHLHTLIVPRREQPVSPALGDLQCFW